MSVQHVFINSGSALSGVFNIGGSNRGAALLIPTITSAQLFLQVGVSSAAATMRRLWKSDGSAEWSWNVGPGSAAVVISDALWPFTHARIEASANQVTSGSAVTSFAVLTRRE